MNTRISVNPNIHFGKPCITGTRIPVQSILELVSEGISFTDIIRDYYSNIEIPDIKACFQYAIEIIAAEEINVTKLRKAPLYNE